MNNFFIYKNIIKNKHCVVILTDLPVGRQVSESKTLFGMLIFISLPIGRQAWQCVC